MSIQYTVPGFELTTFEHESPPITTWLGRAPALPDWLLLAITCFSHRDRSKHRIILRLGHWRAHYETILGDSESEGSPVIER